MRKWANCRQINAQLIFKDAENRFVIAQALYLDKCRIAYHHGNKTDFVQNENCRSFKIKALTLSTVSVGMCFYQVLQQSLKIIIKNNKNIGLIRRGRITYTKNKYIKPKEK